MSLLRLATALWRKIRELPTTPDLSTLSILITLCLVQQWYLTTVAPIAADEVLTLFEDSYSSLGSNLLMTSPCASPKIIGWNVCLVLFSVYDSWSDDSSGSPSSVGSGCP